MVYCIRCLIIFIELLSSHFVLCGAGFTKAIQEVHLDSNIQLLDCPGIVFDDSESDAHHVLLKNCVNVDNLEDPAPAVAALLQRYDHGGCVKEREREGVVVVLDILWMKQKSSNTNILNICYNPNG